MFVPRTHFVNLHAQAKLLWEQKAESHLLDCLLTMCEMSACHQDSLLLGDSGHKTKSHISRRFARCTDAVCQSDMQHYSGESSPRPLYPLQAPRPAEPGLPTQN